MNHSVIVLSNRRELYVERALASLANVEGVKDITLIDDSGDFLWRNRMQRYQTHVPFKVVAVGSKPRGYQTAMQRVFDVARNRRGHVFFLEEDFEITTRIKLDDLAAILDNNLELVQVALQRQPWYANEKMPGKDGEPLGVIGALRAGGREFVDMGGWIHHNAGFTGNPSLIAARTFTQSWPTGAWTEMQFSDRMRAMGAAFAYYGAEGDQHVVHIGHERAETSGGY